MDYRSLYRQWWIACVICIAVSPALFVQAEDDETASDSSEVELSQVGALIDYARDVQPIFAAKCLSCHGPEEAKNDFRVDDADTLLAYIEPGDLESSSLWADYLVTDDPDMRMPPASGEPHTHLTGAELATIKLWIEEGGMWNAAPPVVETTAVEEHLSTPARIWRFQGLFHPATTHFPIALLTVSAVFVFLSFLRPETCEPGAFHCLWIGAVGAVVASVAGWSYAVYEGYGASASFDLQNSAIDRHRWLGVGVAALALGLIPIAVYVRRKEDFGMRAVWLLGSVLLVSGVGIVGFQGGELTYGEGHYEKEFVKFFPSAVPPVEAETTTQDAVDSEAEVTTDEPSPPPIVETEVEGEAEPPADDAS